MTSTAIPIASGRFIGFGVFDIHRLLTLLEEPV
jgi:hypothetical protein